MLKLQDLVESLEVNFSTFINCRKNLNFRQNSLINEFEHTIVKLVILKLHPQYVTKANRDMLSTVNVIQIVLQNIYHT